MKYLKQKWANPSFRIDVYSILAGLIYTVLALFYCSYELKDLPKPLPLANVRILGLYLCLFFPSLFIIHFLTTTLFYFRKNFHSMNAVSDLRAIAITAMSFLVISFLLMSMVVFSYRNDILADSQVWQEVKDTVPQLTNGYKIQEEALLAIKNGRQDEITFIKKYGGIIPENISDKELLTKVMEVIDAQKQTK